MKLYVVLDSWNTHFGGGTNIEVFTDKNKAQVYILKQLEQAISPSQRRPKVPHGTRTASSRCQTLQS